MAKVYKTPGVYIEEKNAFPNSIVPVATAVPAFIGYTEKAVRDDRSLLLVPTRISSYGAYQQFFGAGPLTKFTVAAGEAPGVPYRLTLTESYFTLHSQLKMFFANGGTDCYIVSVGGYTRADGTANVVEAAELRKGIAPLEKEPEPTLLVIPELTTIPLERDKDGNVSEEALRAMYDLGSESLRHCGVVMGNRFAILDVWMDRENYQDEAYPIQKDIDLFRDSITGPALAWGAAYFPWLQTTAMGASEVSLLNVANLGSVEQVVDYPEGTFDDRGALVDASGFTAAYLNVSVDSLVSLLDQSVNQSVANGEIRSKNALAIKDLLKQIPVVTEESSVKLTQTLQAVSPLFQSLIKDILQELNLLPPSAAMAGIYATVDNSVGVFKSPANVGIGAVIKPAVKINSDQQEDMNVPIGGKAVNAIRSFPGRGVLIWGARTLDGNSLDWRYISVRRTVIYLEQSIKSAVEAYVFEPNTATTWSSVKAMITNFLTNEWKAGTLMGPTASDAFQVDIGLGNTMTPVDILEGYMHIGVKVALTHPAEFILIDFTQQMQKS